MKKKDFSKKNFRSREGIRRGIYLLPNLITTASLFCGFFAIINAINGEFTRAAWFILLAGVFDLLDGRVARLTKTHSDFGIEYDSLCDLSSFGLAPALLAYTWSLRYLEKFGWAAAFLFFACGALRLARYNVQSDNVEKKHFQGLPIPPAAAVMVAFIMFQENFLKNIRVGEQIYLYDYLFFIMVIVLALLMVSNVRYSSFKTLKLNRKQSFFALVLVAVTLFFVASLPSLMIFVIAVIYMMSGLFEEIYLRLRPHQTRNSTILSRQNVQTQKDHLKVIKN